MKRILKIFSAGVLSLTVLWSCADWTRPENISYEPDGVGGSDKGEDYYADLRAWKAGRTVDENGVPNRPVTFMWFSDWSPTGADMSSQMMGIPDSVDFISMWGNWKNLSEAAKKDLKDLQTIKGTKVLLCFIVDNIGAQITPYKMDDDGNYVINGKTFSTEAEAVAEFWGWYGDSWGNTTHGEEADKEPAIRKYARAIVDTVYKYGYDGFDYDLEPNYGHHGNIASSLDNNTIFLDELSKAFGPKSGTDKLLCVDGEPDQLDPQCGEMINFFLLQAYGDSRVSHTDSRINALLYNYEGVLSPERVMGMTVLNSNFESYGTTGGPTYTMRNGETTFQLNAFAQYTYPGIDCRIGGIGVFRPVFDKDYTWYRKAMKTLHSPLPEGAEEGEE